MTEHSSLVERPKTLATTPALEPGASLDLRLEEFIEPEQAAGLLRKSPATLEQWRSKRIGLRYYKFGGGVFYKKSDVLAFMEAGAVDPQSRPKQKQPARRGGASRKEVDRKR
jgi:helix-turn-helix protein